MQHKNRENYLRNFDLQIYVNQKHSLPIEIADTNYYTLDC